MVTSGLLCCFAKDFHPGRPAPPPPVPGDICPLLSPRRYATDQTFTSLALYEIYAKLDTYTSAAYKIYATHLVISTETSTITTESNTQQRNHYTKVNASSCTKYYVSGDRRERYQVLSHERRSQYVFKPLIQKQQ